PTLAHHPHFASIVQTLQVLCTRAHDSPFPGPYPRGPADLMSLASRLITRMYRRQRRIGNLTALFKGRPPLYRSSSWHALLPARCWRKSTARAWHPSNDSTTTVRDISY